MLCLNCGKDIGEQVGQCEECQIHKAESSEDQSIQDDLPSESQKDELQNFGNAGFFYRLLAYFIDQSIVSTVSGMIIFFLIFIIGIGIGIGALTKGFDPSTFSSEKIWAVIFLAITIVLTIHITLGWLYYALLESSSLQATIGKLIFGVAVCDLEHQPIGFKKASGRYFGRLLSIATVGIGFLMCAFTKEKQALHDILSSCYVIKNKQISDTRLIVSSIIAIGLFFSSSLIQVPASLNKFRNFNAQNDHSIGNNSTTPKAKNNYPTGSSVDTESITEKPAYLSGVFRGKQFIVNAISYNSESNTLLFKSSASPTPRHAIKIVFTEKEKPGTTEFIHINKQSFKGIPRVHLVEKILGESIPKSDLFESGRDYLLSIRFTNVNEETIHGTISLSLNQEYTELSGEFVAAVD